MDGGLVDDGEEEVSGKRGLGDLGEDKDMILSMSISTAGRAGTKV